jgi:hypothetical protein
MPAKCPSARLECERDDCRDDVRVRVRGVDGHSIPADVGLDDDDVAPRDELPHASHGADGSTHEVAGRVRRVRRVVSRFLRDRACDGELGVLGVALGEAIIANLTHAAGLHDVEPAPVPNGAPGPSSRPEHARRGTDAQQHLAPRGSRHVGGGGGRERALGG